MIRAAIAASISVALLYGCSAGPLPVGTFRGDRHFAVNPGTDPVVADQLRRIELKLRDDGMATLEDGGLPWEGHVVRDGETLSFEVYAVDGVNVSKQAGDLPRRLTLRILAEGTLKYGDTVLKKTKS